MCVCVYVCVCVKQCTTTIIHEFSIYNRFVVEQWPHQLWGLVYVRYFLDEEYVDNLVFFLESRHILEQNLLHNIALMYVEVLLELI